MPRTRKKRAALIPVKSKKEKRHEERTPEMKILYFEGDMKARGVTADLSPSGVGFYSAKAFTSGDEVEVRVGREPIIRKARVMWAEDRDSYHRIGARFV